MDLEEALSASVSLFLRERVDGAEDLVVADEFEDFLAVEYDFVCEEGSFEKKDDDGHANLGIWRGWLLPIRRGWSLSNKRWSLS